MRNWNSFFHLHRCKKPPFIPPSKIASKTAFVILWYPIQRRQRKLKKDVKASFILAGIFSCVGLNSNRRFFPSNKIYSSILVQSSFRPKIKDEYIAWVCMGLHGFGFGIMAVLTISVINFSLKLLLSWI